MARIEIPLTSREIALQTYHGYTSNPHQFIRGMIPQLEQDQLSYLDGLLAGSAMVALQQNPDAAQKILGGNLFRLTCTDRQVKQQGKKLPDLAASFPRTLDEVRRLTEGLLQAGSTIEVLTRQRLMRMERDDPEVGVIIRQLVEQSTDFGIENIDAFVEGAHDTHLNLRFLDTDAALPKPAIVEPKPSSLPVVNRSIARAGLLETILDPDQFVYKTIDEVDKYAPGMVNRILKASQVAPSPEYYLLPASFVIFCFLKEFQQRQRTFPIILEQDQIKHPDPEIAKLMEAEETREKLAKLGLVLAVDNSKRLGELFAKYRESILEEIKSTNPHLSWGIDKLLTPLVSLGSDQVFAGVNGVVNQYSTIKTASRLYNHN